MKWLQSNFQPLFDAIGYVCPSHFLPYTPIPNPLRLRLGKSATFSPIHHPPHSGISHRTASSGLSEKRIEIFPYLVWIQIHPTAHTRINIIIAIIVLGCRYLLKPLSSATTKIYYFLLIVLLRPNTPYKGIFGSPICIISARTPGLSSPPINNIFSCHFTADAPATPIEISFIRVQVLLVV